LTGESRVALRQLIDQAQQELLARDADRAVELLGTALDADAPTEAVAWSVIGQALQQLARHRESTNAFSRCATLVEQSVATPLDVFDAVQISRALEELGRHDEAVKVLERSGGTETDPETLRRIVADQQSHGEQMASAVRLLRLARLDPSSAVTSLEQAVIADSSIPYRLELARALIVAGDLHRAVTELNRVLEERSQEPSAVMLLSQVDGMIGQPEWGLERLDEALTHRPGNPQLLKGRAALRQARRELVAAFEDITAAMAANPADPELAITAGRLLHDMGRWEGSSQVLDIVGRRPLNPEQIAEAEAYRGSSLLKLGRDGEAEQAFAVALRSLPRHPLTLLLRGKGAYGRGRYEAALADLQAAIDEAARRGDRQLQQEALQWAGEVLFQMDRTDEALQALEAATAIQPTAFAVGTRGQILASLGRLEEAVDALRSALALDDRLDWIWIELGRTLSQSGRYKEAEDALDRALQVNPKSSVALITRGQVHHGVGDAAATVEDLKFAALVAAENHDVNQLMESGLNLYNFEEWELSVQVFETTAQMPMIPEQRAELLAYRGYALNELDRDGEAAASFSEALEAVPGHPRTLYFRGKWACQRNRYEEAIADLPSAVDGAGQRGDISLRQTALQWMGEVLYRLGRLEEALQALDEATALERTAFAVGTRGQVLGSLGRIEEAVAALQEAVTIDDSLAWAWSALGENLRLLERYDSAQDALDRAIELMPDSTFALGTRGQVRHALGDHAGAVEDLVDAAAYSPTHLDPGSWVISSLINTIDLLTPDELGRAQNRFERIGLETPLELLVARSLLMRKLGDGPTALGYVDKFLSEVPNDPVAKALKAQIQLELDRPDIAAQVALESLEADPGYSFARVLLANALFLLDRHNEALQQLEKVLAADPTNMSALSLKAVVLTGYRRYEEAQQIMEPYLADAEFGFFAEGMVGVCLSRTGSVDAALPHLRAAVDMDQTDFNIRCELGDALSLAGDQRGAEVVYGEILAADAGRRLSDRHTLTYTGWALYRLQRFEEALERLQDAVIAAPHSTTARWILGITLLYSGREGLAFEEYAACVSAVADIADRERAGAILEDARYDLEHLGHPPPSSAADQGRRKILTLLEEARLNLPRETADVP
jgi:tetratricopeptide (TPR) repeat protein